LKAQIASNLEKVKQMSNQKEEQVKQTRVLLELPEKSSITTKSSQKDIM
jgi:hypothetical protein